MPDCEVSTHPAKYTKPHITIARSAHIKLGPVVTGMQKSSRFNFIINMCSFHSPIVMCNLHFIVPR